MELLREILLKLARTEERLVSEVDIGSRLSTGERVLDVLWPYSNRRTVILEVLNSEGEKEHRGFQNSDTIEVII